MANLSHSSQGNRGMANGWTLQIITYAQANDLWLIGWFLVGSCWSSVKKKKNKNSWMLGNNSRTKSIDALGSAGRRHFVVSSLATPTFNPKVGLATAVACSVAASCCYCSGSIKTKSQIELLLQHGSHVNGGSNSYSLLLPLYL